MVKYSYSLILEILKEGKESDNNNIIIHCCIKCLDIINNIYNSYHNISIDNNNNNKANIKYKTVKNIIESKNLSNKINDKVIYEEIIIKIIKCIDKYCNINDNANQDEHKEVKLKLKQNCYILLFLLLYTNKEIIEIINKNNEINTLDKVLKDLYMIDENKMNFRFIFVTIFKQLGDKISE